MDAERFYASKFKAARVDGYEVFDVIRRQDKECFTQGLVFERLSIDGVAPAEETLSEVCGEKGKSRVQRMRFKMDVAQTFWVAEVVSRSEFESQVWSVGLTQVSPSSFISLTWQDRLFYLIDKDTLTIL